jgi:hypothetical protein
VNRLISDAEKPAHGTESNQNITSPDGKDGINFCIESKKGSTLLMEEKECPLQATPAAPKYMHATVGKGSAHHRGSAQKPHSVAVGL